MKHFKFSKKDNEIKLSAKPEYYRGETPELNLEQARLNREREQSFRTENATAKENERRKRDLDAPFAVYVGDPSWHVSKNPNVEPGRFEAIHHSLGYGYDEEGRSIHREFKSHLRNPKNGYDRVSLSKDQVAHNPDLVKLMKQYKLNSMEAYVPRNNQNGRTDSKPLRDLNSILDFGSTLSRLRRKSKENPASGINAPAFDPTHPANLAIALGGDVAFRKMFTDQVPRRPAKPGEDRCGCGFLGNEHVTHEQAVDIFAKTGQLLPTHKHAPQFVYDSEGNSILGSEYRKQHSPLLYDMAPQTNENGIKRSRPDIGITKEPHMPVIWVGTEGFGFKRIVRNELGRVGHGEKIRSVLQKYRKKECDACNATGVKNPINRSNSTHCEDCLPGKINRKHVYDAEGNLIGVKKFSLGLGAGRVRYFDDEDKPACSVCNGADEKWSGTGTKQEVVKCRACDGTKKEPELNGNDGHQCTNCNSARSLLRLTPNNVCPKCNGLKYIKSAFGRMPKPEFHETIEEYHGNPKFLEPFEVQKQDGNTISTNVDGWKAHGDPNCLNCHGDDEWQNKETGEPCLYCRVGRYDDEDDVISPAGKKYITPMGVKFPSHVYFKGMIDAYRDNPMANPHTIHSVLHEIDPDTGKSSFETYKVVGDKYEANSDDGKNIPVDSQKMIGTISNGVNLTKSQHKKLLEKSQQNARSVNAKFTQSSADLNDLIETMKDFRSLPISTPQNTEYVTRTAPTVDHKAADDLLDQSYTHIKNALGDETVSDYKKSPHYQSYLETNNRRKELLNGRFPVSESASSKYHPNVQSVIPSIENVVSNYDGANGERGGVGNLLDDVYAHASSVAHDQKTLGAYESPHHEAYQEALNKLMSRVSQYHGEDSRKTQDLKEALESLPKVPPSSTSLGENTNV